MLKLGYDDEAIQRRLANGRLFPLFRGAYVVGRREVTRESLFVAAVLVCGDGAALSHDHAGELLRIRPQARGDIEVSLSRAIRGQGGIRPHERTTFAVMKSRGIPVTTPVQTMIDLAPRLTREEQEAMIGEADKRRLIDPERLRKALDRAPRQPGVGILKRTLDRRTFVLTHTQLERAFVPIAIAAGLGPPTGQRRLGSARVDFFWHELGLVVETDGLAYHRTAAQQAADYRRDNEHTANGLTTLRFSHHEIKFEPDYVRATLARVVKRLVG